MLDMPVVDSMLPASRSRRALARWAVLLVLMVGSPAALRSEEPGFKRVLVPLLTEHDAAGSHNSLWRVSLWAGTSSNDDVYLTTLGAANCIDGSGGVGPCVGLYRLVPGRSEQIIVPALGEWGLRGVIFWVRETDVDDTHFWLAARDESRLNESEGTEIPVVHESEMTPGRLFLPMVPVRPGVRAHLRIYSISRQATPITIRLRDAGTGAVLEEIEHELPSVLGGFEFRYPPVPGFAALFDLGERPAVREHERISIEIVADEPTTELWAFVSLTHNETQHVTLVTPQ